MTTLPATPEERLDLLRRILDLPEMIDRKREMLELVALVWRQPELFKETAENGISLDPKLAKRADTWPIFSEWVEVNPAEAAEWEQASSQPSYRALKEWAARDPDAALAWAIDHSSGVFDGGDANRLMLMTALGTMAANDPAAALKVLDRISDPEAHTKAMKELVDVLGNQDSEGIKKLLLAAQDQADFPALFTGSEIS